jgi:pilus assembly protein Flp/PilA
MSRLIRRFAADQSGASAVEYGLVVSLISVAIIGALVVLGVNLRDKAEYIAEQIHTSGR